MNLLIVWTNDAEKITKIVTQDFLFKEIVQFLRNFRTLKLCSGLTKEMIYRFFKIQYTYYQAPRRGAKSPHGAKYVRPAFFFYLSMTENSQILYNGKMFGPKWFRCREVLPYVYK